MKREKLEKLGKAIDQLQAYYETVESIEDVLKEAGTAGVVTIEMHTHNRRARVTTVAGDAFFYPALAEIRKIRNDLQMAASDMELDFFIAAEKEGVE